MNARTSQIGCVVTFLGLLLTGQVLAETTVTLEGSGGASDNIGRSASAEDGAGILSAGALFNFEEQTQRMDANARGSIYHIVYAKTGYEDETLAALDGKVEFTLRENMFTWLVQDNYGQQTTDPYAPVRPDNRENVNYFTTGPDFQFQLGEQTAVLAGARFSDVQYEIRDLANQRVGGSLGLERRLSSSKALSVHASTDQIDYDDELNTDFDRQLAFVRFSTQAARTDLALDLGWNAVKSDSETFDGLYLEVTGSRQLSVTATLRVAAGSRYSDAGDIFRFYQGSDQDVGNTQDIEGVGNPFQNNYASFNLNLMKNRTSLDIRLLFSDEDYEGLDALDRSRLGIGGSATRQFRSDLNGTLGFDFYSREYDVGGRSDDDSRLYGELRWQYSRTLQARLLYDRFNRSSNEVGSDYSENRLFLILAFAPDL